MKNIQSFDLFNEMKNEKWIKDAISNKGSLKKSLGKEDDEKLSKSEINKELSKLKAKDKDKDKPGTQLDKKDATKKRRLELAKTLRSLKEHQETDNYMFFGNLETMKRLVDELLEMDKSEIDSILSEHDWASDHISVATENLEQVFDFLAGHNSPEEKPLLGGPESSHTVHDNHMRDMVKPEEEEPKNIKGFEDFK